MPQSVRDAPYTLPECWGHELMGDDKPAAQSSGDTLPAKRAALSAPCLRNASAARGRVVEGDRRPAGASERDVHGHLCQGRYRHAAPCSGLRSRRSAMKLSKAIDLYIAKRQAVGEKFYSPAAVLRAFSRSYGDEELTSLTPDQVSSFLAGPRTGPATWRHKYGTLRVFFEHWRLREELHTVPLPPPAPKYTTSFVPYIYSISELRLLLAAVP